MVNANGLFERASCSLLAYAACDLGVGNLLRCHHLVGDLSGPLAPELHNRTSS